MTRNNLIFTHGAVFSVGLAAAMIGNSLRDPGASASEEARGPSSRSQSAHAGGRGGEGGDAAAGDKTARDGSRTTGKKVGTPAERLSSLVRINDAFERQRALMDLIDSLGPNEFAAMADQFRELDHLGDSRGEYDLLLRGWAKADPMGAMTYAAENPQRGARSTILQTWAGNDPGAAERWATENFDGEGANPFMPAVIRGIAANDLAKASELAIAMPQSRERAEAVDAITRALFMQGPEAAMAYPATITGDDALKGGFVATIADRMARKDPEKTAQWLASMDEGPIQARAARGVAEALARTDAQNAASWVRKLKPEAQAEAARGVIPIMSGSDIAGTARWVSGLAGTPNYDSVVEEFVWSCNTRAPEQSAAWIQGVSDPNQQRRLFHRMLGEWSQRDANAVRQWIAANPVPDDVRRRFIR
ncbi:MAG: hypothetical protein EOP88_12680 [Verrucomicrobiaceae bacterium]|nr:MAG: hypothetical protein EOP88_12680 [Verrucomicrobiaceae bacterium]